MVCAVLTLGAGASCGSPSLRSGTTVVPKLTAQRLGSLRCAMTYDGDWLGGMPPVDCLEQDLDLAARRGVELVIDLRTRGLRKVAPLEELVQSAGMDLVRVPLHGADAELETASDLGFISGEAIDRVREILRAPGRRRTLLLDDDGTLASMVYAIHLAVDENVTEAEALRAARATGLSAEHEAFVKEQVRRLRDETS